MEHSPHRRVEGEEPETDGEPVPEEVIDGIEDALNDDIATEEEVLEAFRS